MLTVFERNYFMTPVVISSIQVGDVHVLKVPTEK
jgi:hypothetical protein